MQYKNSNSRSLRYRDGVILLGPGLGLGAWAWRYHHILHLFDHHDRCPHYRFNFQVLLLLLLMAFVWMVLLLLLLDFLVVIC
jgi:hypothetical protein